MDYSSSDESDSGAGFNVPLLPDDTNALFQFEPMPGALFERKKRSTNGKPSAGSYFPVKEIAKRRMNPSSFAWQTSLKAC